MNEQTQQPKVSVIIPVYNAEKYLRQCLDSIVNQTIPMWEIICVDDGSEDSSLEIMQEYADLDDRFHIFQQENRGAGTARNYGMKQASGKFLYFMDADDYCVPDFMEKATRYAEEKSCDILVFNYCRFDNGTGAREYRDGLVRTRIPTEKDTFSYLDNPKQICSIVNPTPWNKLYLNSFVRESKLQWLDVSTTNDITFATMSVLMAKRIAYLDKTCLFYRVNHASSITSKKKYRQDNVIKAVLAVDKLAQSLEYYDILKFSIREFIAANLLGALKGYTPDPCSVPYLEFEKRIDAIFFSYPLFLNCTERDFCSKQRFEQVAEYRFRAMTRQDFSFAPKIVVSMTSFPERIDKVYIAINSLFRQTRKPDIFLLWLAENQFPNREKDLPSDLLEYQALGLQIRWCKEDIRPHKKYYYTMLEYPDDIVITVDDDLRYAPFLIEKLFLSYLCHPYAVSSVRTHLITADQRGSIASYSEWIKEYSGLIGVPSMQLFATSGAGTLFPPHCLALETFDIERIKSLCVNADDLWLKIMQVKKGTPVVLIDGNNQLDYIEDTQRIALQNTNVYRSRNDDQLHSILAVYDADHSLEQIILSEKRTAITPAVNVDFIENNSYGLFQRSTASIEAERQTQFVKRQLREIKNSRSYLLGRAITFIPRKLRGGIRCYQEHGMVYTLGRIRVKIRRLFLGRE